MVEAGDPGGGGLGTAAGMSEVPGMPGQPGWDEDDSCPSLSTAPAAAHERAGSAAAANYMLQAAGRGGSRTSSLHGRSSRGPSSATSSVTSDISSLNGCASVSVHAVALLLDHSIAGVFTLLGFATTSFDVPS